MMFYQEDILEEGVVQQWGTHVSKKYVDKDTSKEVRKAAGPFLKVSFSFLFFGMHLVNK
jgi:translation initiation factor 5